MIGKLIGNHRWASWAAFYRSATARPPVHHKELLSVQRMRGIAVLMVLAVHIEDAAHHLPGREWLASYYTRHIGYSGPDMFFVISGFIMAYITFGMTFQWRRWLVNRFTRIYPMYMFFTGLVILLWLYNPALTMGSGEHDWLSALKSWLIIPQPGLPMLFVGWTVEHEIVFYVIVFLAASWLSVNALTWVLLLLSVLGLFKWLWVRASGLDFWDFHLLSLFIIQFAMGVLVYRFWERTAALGWVVPLLLGGVLFVIAVLYAQSGIINDEQPLRIFTFGGAYSLWLLALLNLERQRRARGLVPKHRDALVLIGDASYAIYLSHPFLIAVFARVFANLHISPPMQVVLVVAAGVAILTIGMLIHVAMERPVIALGKYWSRPSLVVSPVGART